MTCSQNDRCVDVPDAARNSRLSPAGLPAAAMIMVWVASTPTAGAADRFEPITTGDRVETSSLITIESAIGTASETGQTTEFRFEPELEAQISDRWKLTTIGRIRIDAMDELEPGSPSRAEVSNLSRRALVGDRVDVALREFYLEARLGRASLAIGKQQIVWGQADGLKVMDVVNPQDFRQFILEPFSDSRIPLWSVNLEVPVGEMALALVWVPDQTYHELPEPDGLFAFTSPVLITSPPPGVPAITRSVDRPNRVLIDSDAGLQLSGFWRGWDLTLNYFYHYDDTPVFVRATTSGGGGPVVVVTPEYRRTHLVGTTFSNAFGDLTVRGELAVFLGRSFSVGNPADLDGVARSDEVAYVLGLDWTGLAETLVSFQLFESRVTDNERGLGRDQTETNLTVLVRHEMLNDTLVLETLWLHSVNRGDGLVRPKVTYHLDDHTTIWFGTDLFYGGDGGLFGQFDANDRVLLGIQWGF